MARKDFIRTHIISKKISVKFFADESDMVQVRTIMFDEGPGLTFPLAEVEGGFHL